ncbi:SMAD/FHA domain-containing protein [Spinellus fusiger]|nr:SMAD/FHA domain-containing protein [Spinellus fusiger]
MPSPRSSRQSRSHSYSRRRHSPSRSRSPSRPSRSRSRSRSQSRSPHSQRARYQRPNNPPSSGRPRDNSTRHERGRKYEWGGEQDIEKKEEEEVVEKEVPNFGLSGKLASETNTIKGVELKYNEPPEACKPKHQWRLYVFKGKEQIELLHIHRQSAYLVGRDRVVIDVPVDHPSCSKQHAVLQFRRVADTTAKRENPRNEVKPFIIDLDSTNGTFLNGERIPNTRYIELRLKDVLKFGNSTREYVLLHSDVGDA